MYSVVFRQISHLENKTRFIHTSLVYNSLVKTMKKVMNRSNIKSKKGQYYDNHFTNTVPTTHFTGGVPGKQIHNSKRMNVLNKLFMRHITDLMATGECSSYFVGHGIEISHVEISADCTIVSIYWIARGTKEDDIVEPLLNRHVGLLRHELAQLRVVGVLPKLQFVKNRQYAATAEVDRLLEAADFGDDHIPVDLSKKLITQLELKTNLEPQIKDKIQELEDEDDIIDEEPIPSMPQQIFNLNHSQIMEYILKSKKRLHTSQRLGDKNAHIVSTARNENVITFANNQEERATFRKFLQQRQILKERILKLDKNFEPGRELLKEEWYERQKKSVYDYADALEKDEDDFIEESEK